MQPAEHGAPDSSRDEPHGCQHHENQTDAGSLAHAANPHFVRLDLASIVHHQDADRAELDLIGCLVPALYLIHRSIRRRFVVEHRKHDLLVTHLLTSLILGASTPAASPPSAGLRPSVWRSRGIRARAGSPRCRWAPCPRTYSMSC